MIPREDELIAPEPRYFSEIVSSADGDINYSLRKGAPQLDEESRQFKQELDAVLLQMRLAFPLDLVAKKIDYKILPIARTGLGGSEPNPHLALEDLNRAKIELTSQGFELRTKYLWGLFTPCLILLGLCVVMVVGGLLLNRNADMFVNSLGIAPDQLQQLGHAIGGVGFAFLGLTLGLYSSTMIKTRNLTFENLHRIGNIHKYTPSRYALYLGVIMFTLCILLFFRVVEIGIAGNLLNDFVKTPSIGILIGLVTGLGEASAVSIISRNINVSLTHAKR